MSAEHENQPPPRTLPGDVAGEDVDVRAAASGDAAAFHRIVDRHAPSLFRIAVSMVGNAIDAEDVLQEAMAGAYRGLARFESRSSVKTWLTRIVITQAAKFRRKRKREPVAMVAESTGSFGSMDGSGAAVDARLDLQTALAKLSPEHRQVLVLREIEQLSYDEIAKVLGVAKGTVESRLFRGRAELRRRLGAYEV